MQTSVVMIFEKPRPSTRTAAGTFGGPLPGPCAKHSWPPAAWLNPAWKKQIFGEKESKTPQKLRM
jgi:hypothetical protein